MLGTRFKSWNIFDSALTGSSTGHHFWETRALADELVRRGETVRIFSHDQAPSREQFPGTEVIPAFSLFLYANISDDRIWAPMEQFVVHNRTFAYELSKLDRSQFRDSLVLFPTIDEHHLLGIFRWLGTFERGTGPKAAIGLLSPLDGWSDPDRATKTYATLWKECPKSVRSDLAFFSRTTAGTELFAKRIGMPTRKLPFIVPEEHFARRSRPEPMARRPMLVAFVGGARRERGGEFMAEVVKQCAGPGIEFFIQVRDGEDRGFDTHGLTALSDLPHVRLHAGPLEREEYYGTIANSVVLLPYLPSHYRWRDSGVYNEAKMLDAPVLVSAGTWMADEVASLGNGLVIEDYSAAAIVKCIARARETLPELRAAAARVGMTMREQSGAGRCLDAIAASFAGSGEAGA